MRRLFLFLIIAICNGLFLETVAQPGSIAFDQMRKFTGTQTPNRKDSSLSYLTNRIDGAVHYLYPLYQAIGWESRFKKANNPSPYYEIFSQMLSMVGDYRMADYYSQQSYDSLPPAANESIRQILTGLKNLQSIDAAAYVAGMAMNTRVVIVNEGHDKPSHRAFTYSLLEQLYKEGYRYFAMETFSNLAGNPMDRLSVNTGYFTAEPVAGELVRKALALGFTLLPYEDSIASRHTGTQRDSAQAANLNAILKRDKDAKILVHAGYGHASELALSSGYVPMALALKNISGVDPLTVNQTLLSEGSSYEYGRRLYNALLEKIPITQSEVLLQDQRPLNLIGSDGYDIFVYHPPAIYKNNRPTWLSLNGERKEVTISPQEKALFLLQAYYADEYDPERINEKVPADQTYLPSDYGYYSLYLRPGNYKLVLRDVSYKIIAVKDREVK